MSICFNEKDVRTMGRVSMGVRGISLKRDDLVIGAAKIQEDDQVLVISQNGYGKRTPANEYKIQNRGGMGVKTISVTDKTGLVCAIDTVKGDEDIMLINDSNVVIRLKVEEISIFGRAAQGVRVMRVDDETKVVGISKLPHEEEKEEDAE